MDGVSAAAPGHIQNFLNVQVGFSRRRRANEVRLVGVAHVQRRPVHFRINRHRGNAQLAAGAHHPHRDFSPVSDQDLLEHALCFVPWSGCKLPIVIQTRFVSGHGFSRAENALFSYLSSRASATVRMRASASREPALSSSKGTLRLLAARIKPKRPSRLGRKGRCPEEGGKLYWFELVGCSTMPPGCWAALAAFAFFVAMVLSTQSSAVFKSAVCWSGVSHSVSAFSRYMRFM